MNVSVRNEFGDLKQEMTVNYLPPLRIEEAETLGNSLFMFPVKCRVAQFEAYFRISLLDFGLTNRPFDCVTSLMRDLFLLLKEESPQRRKNEEISREPDQVY